MSVEIETFLGTLAIHALTNNYEFRVAARSTDMMTVEYVDRNKDPVRVIARMVSSNEVLRAKSYAVMARDIASVLVAGLAPPGGL